MNVPPVVLFGQSLIHDERNQPRGAIKRNIIIMSAIIITKRASLPDEVLDMRENLCPGPALSFQKPI